MTEIFKITNSNLESTREKSIEVHAFLLKFLSKYEDCTRGGIHDFIELTLFNMINLSIKEINHYLKDGHKQVNANEIMSIVVYSYQKILDRIKRNLENLQEVNFQ
jgi:hypothetical protein